MMSALTCSTRLVVAPKAPPPMHVTQQRARLLSSLTAGPSSSGAASTRPRSHLMAKRREIEPAYFGDLFDGMAEMVMENPITRLPHGDLLIMIKSVETMQEAAKALGLISRQVAARAEAGEEDAEWHLRKKLLVALMEVTWTKLRQPNLTFEVMANPARYKTGTYFCCDVIEALAALSVPPEMLMKAFELNKAQRPAADKGVKASLRDLAGALAAMKADNQLRLVVGSQKGRQDGIRFREDVRMYVSGMPEVGAPPPAPAPPARPVSENVAMPTRMEVSV